MPGAPNWEMLHLVRAVGGERFDKSEWVDNLKHPHSDNLRAEALAHEWIDAYAASDDTRIAWCAREFDSILAIHEESFGGGEPFSMLYADRSARVILALSHVAASTGWSELQHRAERWLRQYVALLALGQSAQAQDLGGPADWKVDLADAGKGCVLEGRGTVWQSAKPGVALAGRRSWMRVREPWGEPQGFVSALSPALASAMGRAEPPGDEHGYTALADALRNRGWLGGSAALWPLSMDEQQSLELIATESPGAIAAAFAMVQLPIRYGLHILRGADAVVSWLDHSPPSDKPPAMVGAIRHSDGFTIRACCSPGWYNDVADESCRATGIDSVVRLIITAPGRDEVRVEVPIGRVLWYGYVGIDGAKVLPPTASDGEPAPGVTPPQPRPPITGAGGPPPAPARRRRRSFWQRIMALFGG